jgi:CBS domain-containing protein
MKKQFAVFERSVDTVSPKGTVHPVVALLNEHNFETQATLPSGRALSIH